MSVQDIVENKLNARLNDPQEGPEMRELNAVFQFNLSGDETGNWFVDLKEGKAGAGDHASPDCTVSMDSSDFIDLYNGDTQGAMLFMSGRLQIEGDMGLALKLGELMG